MKYVHDTFVRVMTVGITAMAANAVRAEVPPAILPVAPFDTRLSALALEDVLRCLERSHPLVLAALRDIDVATAETLAAEGGFDTTWKTKGSAQPLGYYDGIAVDSVVEQPTSLWGITPFAGYRLGVNKFPYYEGKYRTLRYGEVRAGANVPLLRNGRIDRRRANLFKTELGEQLAGLSYVQQTIELRRAASHRYWAWVAAGHKHRIAELLLRNVATRQAALDDRVKAGDLPMIDAKDNARALEQRRNQLALTERSLEQATIELSLFLRDVNGRPLLAKREQLPSGWPVADVSELNVASSIRSAVQRRPEPKRLDIQQRQYGIELEYTENQQAPALDLQVVGSQDFGPPADDRPDLAIPVMEVGVVLDLPLQNRVSEGRAAALRAQLQRTAEQRRFASEKVATEVQDSLSAVRRARDRIEISRREVALALELEDAERARFDAGDSQLLILNIREQQTAEAELREVDALFDYQRALADWRAACGQ
jgi:outer membrane protein, heavy metal efflux system